YAAKGSSNLLKNSTASLKLSASLIEWPARSRCRTVEQSLRQLIPSPSPSPPGSWRTGTSESHAVEGGVEIGDEIFWVFDPDRVANQVIFDPDLQTLLGGELVETHQRRLLDQTLYAPQRGRDLRDAACIHHPGSGLKVAGNFERNDTTKAAHLAPRNLVLRMRWQTGVVHGGDPWVGCQKLGERLGVGILPRDTKREGLEATDKEVGDKRINDRSRSGLQTPNPIHELS